MSFCDLGFIRIEIWSNAKNWSDIVLIDILHRFVHTGIITRIAVGLHFDFFLCPQYVGFPPE